MRRVAWALLLWCLLASPAAADNALTKLGRGVVNVVTGVGEIPKAMDHETKKEMDTGTYGGTALINGIVFGAFTGTGKALVRMGAGAYDVVTFAAPWPDNYGPIYRPAYVWNDDPTTSRPTRRQ